MTEAVERQAAHPAPKLRILAAFKGTENDLLALFVVLQALRKMETIAQQAVQAFNQVEWVRSNPDGLIGGQGYIIAVSDLREKLAEVNRLLGEVKHPVLDECYNNPVWREIKQGYLQRLRGEEQSNTVPPPELTDDGTEEPGPGIEDIEVSDGSADEADEQVVAFNFIEGGMPTAEVQAVVAAARMAESAGMHGLTANEMVLVAAEFGMNDPDEVRAAVQAALVSRRLVTDQRGWLQVARD